MGNGWATVGALTESAALFLENNTGIVNRVSRESERTFGRGIGDTVYVRRNAALTDAGEYSGSITAVDVGGDKVAVTIEKQFYKAHKLSAEDMRLNVADFSSQVLYPLMSSVRVSVDKYLKSKMLGQFAANKTGTIGSELLSLANVIDGVTALKTAKVSWERGYNCILTPGSEAGLLKVAQFQSRDYGDAANSDLRAGRLSPISNISEFFTTNLCGTFAQGDVAGTVLVKGASQTGTSIIVDGFTAATGTVKSGTRLTFNGDSQVYTVIQDCTIAGNETTLVITPSKSSAAANDAAVTFETAYKENILFHPAAVAAAVVAPEPFAESGASSIVTSDGISMRLSIVRDALDQLIVVDTLCGASVITPTGGLILQGAS